MALQLTGGPKVAALLRHKCITFTSRGVVPVLGGERQQLTASFFYFTNVFILALVSVGTLNTTLLQRSNEVAASL